MRFGKVFLVYVGLNLVMAPLGAVSADDDKEAEALRVLQRKVAQREKQAAAAKNPAVLPNGQKLSLAAIEQMYLNGQISARQFHRYVEAMESESAPQRPDRGSSVHSNAIVVLRQSQADPRKNPPPGPALQASQISQVNPAAAAGEQGDDVEQSFADLEAKMDRLLRWKTEREKGATNVGTNGVGDAGATLTKRQRLDQLLRLYIQGKLSEKEYNEQRAKTIAGPD